MGIAILMALAGCDGGDSPSAGSRKVQGIKVRCTDEGTTLEGSTVTASADGVHLPVTNTTDDVARLVATPVQENPTHTIPPGRSTAVVLAPPGQLRLYCGPQGMNQRDRSVTVTVVDPHRFYRSVNLAEALGCEPDQGVDGAPAGWGSTARQAADAFAAQIDAQVKVTEGNGYRDHDRQEFLLYIDGRGYGTLDAYPDVHPDLGDQYRAALGYVCSTREWPGYKPGTVGGDG